MALWGRESSVHLRTSLQYRHTERSTVRKTEGQIDRTYRSFAINNHMLYDAIIIYSSFIFFFICIKPIKECQLLFSIFNLLHRRASTIINMEFTMQVIHIIMTASLSVCVCSEGACLL